MHNTSPPLLYKVFSFTIFKTQVFFFNDINVEEISSNTKQLQEGYTNLGYVVISFSG